MSNARDVQTAARKRATHPDFVRTFSVYALRDRTVPHIVTWVTTTSASPPLLLI
jgi:hypothetical protein